MGHALWMALMSYEWHGINYLRKIAVMEYLSTKILGTNMKLFQG